MEVKFIAEAELPTALGEFSIHGFEDIVTGKEHVVLAMGDLSDDQPVLCRVHSECLTGDALFSLRCDCGPQLQFAMEKIAAEGRGMIIYLRQEGRGIGLLNKIKAYALQDAGADTVEANVKLGFEPDGREYDVCKPILEHFGVRRLRLMTNNPRKVDALSDLGIEVVDRVPIEIGLNQHNESYLAVKVSKMGHLLRN
ncbi:GTP cyclohydrolase II [Pseudohongiella spirulinae]|uniref:GTP cyclohydrolase-2 n=1 Tax=Pseudohongiella spirulinae TaxID=1249552 RepID=A0A0S2KAN2_9GAMM|nr:GTP cyclohydrolase II [Pseudohongiella spirulinae]ALO45409.1 GTP cyclohydrolase [Pseudohongiella spirulinae]